MKADLILKNGMVWTVDDALPQASAVAIRGTDIIAVGSDSDMEPLTGANTHIIDLHGRLVLPGFNDAHTHFMGAAIRAAQSFDLFGVSSMEDLASKLRAFADANPDAPVLYGRRWDRAWFKDSGWQTDSWPTRHDLDALEPHRPVVISDIDAHSYWVNTAALEWVGYTADTPEPRGGDIFREPDGYPSGIVTETAMQPFRQTYDPNPATFEPFLRETIAQWNALGVTSLSHNNDRPKLNPVYIRMAGEGTLNLRINQWMYMSDGMDEILSMYNRFKDGEMVRVCGVKFFIDGVLSSHTGWLLEPYRDQAQKVGYPVQPVDELRRDMLTVDAAGLQIITHAIGDRGVRETLDIYAEALQTHGSRDHRHRIEHAEMLHPDDQRRFAELGVIASMTPLHCTACIETYLKDRIGDHRAAYAYPWRSLIDQGVHVAFGTDWPAVDQLTPNPLEELYGAVTRTLPQNVHLPVWHPELRLTLAQAIRSTTLEGAYAEFMEHRKGTISAGKLADLCVLSQNVLELEPAALLDTQVDMTIVDGRIVHQASE